jgi:hypothetical protein
MSLLPNHWYYNTESGKLENGNNFDNLGNNLFGGLGWHELNISGSASETQAAAEAVKEFPTGKTPTTSTVKAVENQTPGTPLGGVAAIGDFFQRLTQENTWIRTAEVVIGALLIISGLMKLSGAGADIGDIVKKVRP